MSPAPRTTSLTLVWLGPFRVILRFWRKEAWHPVCLPLVFWVYRSDNIYFSESYSRLDMFVCFLREAFPDHSV